MDSIFTNSWTTLPVAIKKSKRSPWSEESNGLPYIDGGGVYACARSCDVRQSIFLIKAIIFDYFSKLAHLEHSTYIKENYKTNKMIISQATRVEIVILKINRKALRMNSNPFSPRQTQWLIFSLSLRKCSIISLHPFKIWSTKLSFQKSGIILDTL